VASGLLLATPALAGGPPSFTITSVVLEGDNVAGVGLVTRIDNIAVNNLGEWLVEADTNNADTTADSVLLKDGVLLLREGDSLAEPVGASIGSFDSVVLNNLGNSAWNFFLDGTAGGSDDSGIYFNTTLVVQESDTPTAPGFSEGTTYIGFFDVKVNNGNDFISVLSVDDPIIPTSVDRAIIGFEGTEGGFTQVLIAKEGDVLPPQTEGVADFGTGPHSSALNDSGQMVIFVDLDGNTAVDGVIYFFEPVVALGPRAFSFVKLAQEGDPSPVLARDWSSLSSPELDLNNSGEHVYSGSLTGDTASNLLIVKNGAKFRQEGDNPPGIGGFTLTSFGTGPLEISDGGSVVWYGDWNDPNTDVDTGLFLDDQLLVQEGVTQIGGQTVDTLRGIEDGYHMSPDGSYIIFEAVLVGGVDGAFLIEFENPCPEDITGDGVVNVLDLIELLLCFGQPAVPGCEAEDVNGDGTVNVLDLIDLLLEFGQACP
jgi:hypothetical protein